MRLTPAERAVVKAALAAGYVTAEEVDAAPQRSGSLLPFLAARVTPEQLRELRAVLSKAQRAEDDEPAPAPKDVGRYQIVRPLGQGGQAAVYLARDPKLQREVALKIVLPGAEAETIQRQLLEARAAARLEHPGIVRLYDAEPDSSGGLRIALEVVPGGSLKDRLRRGPLPPLEAAAFISRAARAIAYAHAHDILHRDIKPGNLLIGRDGSPKVADFGLAKHQDDDQGVTGSGVVIGSPGYIAPEIASGEGPVDQRADVYGLGATLFEALTGRPPFQGSFYAVLTQVMTEDPPSPRSLRPEVDSALSTICLAAIERDPARRTPTATAFAAALEAYLYDDIRPRRATLAALALPGALAAVGALLLLITTLVLVLEIDPGQPEPKQTETAATPPSPTPQPTPSGAIAPTSSVTTVKLDPATLAGSDLPGLEVWAPWHVRLEPAGLRLGATHITASRLELPVHCDGGAFRITVEGRIRCLEQATFLVLDLMRGHHRYWRRLCGVGISGDVSSEHGRHWRGLSVQHDPVADRGRPISRAPNARFRLRLTYQDARFHLEVSGDEGVWYRRSLQLPAPLSPGIYRLRLCGSLLQAPRPDPTFETTYSPQVRARVPRLNIGSLRLEGEAQRAGALTPLPPDDGDGMPERAALLGRLGRALFSPRGEASASARLKRIVNDPTWHPFPKATARFLLAHLLAKQSPDTAAQQLLVLSAAQQQQLQAAPHLITFTIASRLHARWSLNLFDATDAWLKVLARAYAAWGFDQGRPKARARLLSPPPLETPTPAEEDRFLIKLLMTGDVPTPTRSMLARRDLHVFRPYLATYRRAEAALLQHIGVELPSLALAWYDLGGLERAKPLLEELVARRDQTMAGRALANRARAYLGLIALREARWADAVRILELLPADVRRRSPELDRALDEANRALTRRPR